MQAAMQAARALLDGVAKKGHVPQLTAEHPADERGFPPCTGSSGCLSPLAAAHRWRSWAGDTRPTAATHTSLW